MGARDAAAMYGYAGAAAAATRLTPFTQPDPTTNSGADQSQAVSKAAATAAGSTRNTVTQQPFSAVPNMLNNLAVSPNALGDPSVTDLLGLEAT